MADSCENCGAPVEGAFCSQCGQAAASIDMPVADFARDMASEALGLDSRVRMTMGPLLFRPGLVAAEYVAGHRARFVPPFRLYLLTSLVMFLVMSFGELNVGNGEVRSGTGIISIGGSSGPSDSADSVDVASADADAAAADSVDADVFTADSITPDSVVAGTVPAETTTTPEEAAEEADSDFGGRIDTGIERLLEDPERFLDRFIGTLSRAMILLLPLFALLLKFAWWKRLYVHHFVFSMYFHAFSFLVITVSALPGVLGLTRLGMWADLLLFCIPVYLILALKRFHQTGWVSAVGKGILVYGAYAILGGSVVAASLLLSILTF